MRAYVWRRGGVLAACSLCKDTAATQADNDCAHTGESARQSVRARVCECLLGKVEAILSNRHLEINGRRALSPPSLPETESRIIFPGSLSSSPLLEAFLIAPPKHRCLFKVRRSQGTTHIFNYITQRKQR